MDSRNNLINFVIAISIIMGFLFISTFLVYYVREKYGAEDECRCTLPLSILVILLSSFGVLVGTFTYYFLDRSILRRKEKPDGIEKTLDFLENEEKQILKKIIENNGQISQNKLSSALGIDSVKVFRRLSSMEKKGIIEKQKNGMTNTVMLKDSLKKLFLH